MSEAEQQHSPAAQPGILIIPNISYICYRNTADLTPGKLVLKKDLKVVGNSEIILFILQLHPPSPPSLPSLVLTKHILFVGKNLWFASEGTNWVSRFLGN